MFSSLELPAGSRDRQVMELLYILLSKPGLPALKLSLCGHALLNLSDLEHKRDEA
jgi:hypothetical protein